MIAAGALFAVINTLSQYGTMIRGIASTDFAFWQYFIAFLFSLPWVIRHGLHALRTDMIGAHLLRVIVSVIGVQCWISGLAHVPIWQAIALIMLSPFFVTLGAVLFLKEVATSARWIAVTLGFIGGMIILAPWSDAFSPYALLPVAAAAFWATTSLITKKMTATQSAESLTVYLLLLLTPINLGFALAGGSGDLSLEFGITGAVLVGAGLLTALAQYFIAKAYSVADAAYLQPFDHIKLPLNVLFGVLAFGFAPPGSMWVGSLLIVGASIYLLREESAVS
jgi:S-adenosylmethionine uptake transporter